MSGGFSMRGSTPGDLAKATIGQSETLWSESQLPCRSLSHSLFAIGWFKNHWAIAGSLAMLGAQILFTYAPVMNKLFHTAPIDAESWLRIAGVAGAAFAAVEFEKWLRFGAHHRDQTRPKPNQGET